MRAAWTALLRSVTCAALRVGGLALAASAVAAQAPLRVVTFNIRYGTANDGVHVWENRRAAVMATIVDHAPHILGVQEALRFQLDEIRTAVARYRVIGVGRDDGRFGGEHAAILVDTGRFVVVAEGTFWLSERPTVPGSTDWGNRVTRITTWTRLADRATGDTVRVYNTHWDHESQPSRERSARAILERVRSQGAPTDAVLLLGDFNAGPTNPALLALVTDSSARLDDLHTKFRPARTWPGTYHGFRGETAGERIDAILGSHPDWEVRDAGIDARNWGGVWASDHFAVWAVVRRERREQSTVAIVNSLLQFALRVSRI